MQCDYGRRPADTNARGAGSHLYSSLLLTVAIMVVGILVPGPAVAAKEHLKVIASGPRLKDWRFRLCGENGCVAKVVLCAPGYHMVYGNMCVVNIHTMPSWEDEMWPVIPPCEGCDATHPTLYELYGRSAR
jgi:hypothetical protein